MDKTQKIICAMAASATVGAITGMLLAPAKGADTRRFIRRIKEKMSGVHHHEPTSDKETLEELRNTLLMQLDIINEQLDKN